MPAAIDFQPDVQIDFQPEEAEQEQLSTNPDVGTMRPIMPTTAGGPRVPLASARETFAALPDVSEGVEAATTPSVNIPRFDIKDSDSAVTQVGKEAVNLLAGIPEFLSSPLGAATAIAAPAAPALTAGLFAADTIKNLGELIASTYKNWDAMSTAEKRKAIVDITGTTEFGLLMGHGAAKPFLPKPMQGPLATGEVLNVPRGAPAPMLGPQLPEGFVPPEPTPIPEVPEALKTTLPLTVAEATKPVEPTPQPEKGPENAIPERSPTPLPVGETPEVSGEVGARIPEPEAPADAQAAQVQPASQEGQARVLPVEQPSAPKPVVEEGGKGEGVSAKEPWQIPREKFIFDQPIPLEKGWTVKVQYLDNPAGPTRGTDVLWQTDKPNKGDSGMGPFGRYKVATVSRERPTRKQPESIIRDERYRQHRIAVEQAFKEGKDIPPDVLKDYPDLKKPTPSTPPQAAAKVEAEVKTVAATEGVRSAKEVKAELLSRIDKAMEDAPEKLLYNEKKHGVIKINIPGDGNFRVPNNLDALGSMRQRVNRISVSPGGPTPKYPSGGVGDIADQAKKAAEAYGSPEAAYLSTKRQLEAIRAQELRTAEENKTQGEQIQGAEHLMRELYGNTKAGELEAKAEAARDVAATYKSGAEGFEKEIARIENIKRKTQAHKDRLADLKERYAQNQDFIKTHERDAERWEQEAAKEKAALEAQPPPEKGPGMVGMGGALEGEVGTGHGADIYGIAERVRAERAKAGQVAEVPPGKGIAAPDSVEHGRQLLAQGVDPEKALADFEKTKRFSADDVAVTRAHGEDLAAAARRVEEKFGTTTQEYLTARKALSDWDARTKVMQTEWNKMGMAQQGETDIDTGTFTGLQREYTRTTGEDFNPAQKRDAERIAADVSKADKAVDEAKPKLETKIDNLPEPGVPRHSDYIIKIAEKIVAKLDARADASRRALKEMSARFSAGVDPTVLVHLTNIGASHIGHWGLNFVKWSDAMVKDVGPKLEDFLKKNGSSLKDIFERSQKLVDAEGDAQGANAGAVKQVIKKTVPKSKIPTALNEQKKAFATYNGGKMDPAQLKTLWTRAKLYINQGNENLPDVVNKLGTDFGLSNDDILRGLSQDASVRRVADDVWAKQKQARILKESAKRWLKNSQETWLQKALPVAARTMFSAKVALHGTVALGTHAPLVAATNPIIFARAFGKMYKLVASPDYYEMQTRELGQRPNWVPANRAGLANDMRVMEDFNDPVLRQAFPKLSQFFDDAFRKVGLSRFKGMGTRGYSVLKILRQDLFDNEWNKLAESERTPAMAKAMAESINHITGVSEIKPFKSAHLFAFAPKLEISRVQVLAGDPLKAVNSMLRLDSMTPAEKWFAMNQFKQAAKVVGVSTGLLLANQQLNNMLGDKKKLNGIPESMGGGGINPMASDFMKFRVAGMNVAWGSPFLTMARLPLRLVQIGMGGDGKTRFIIYPDESMYKTIGSYLRTQSSPLASPIISLVTKADYAGRPLPQIPGYGTPPPVSKRLAAKGVKPYTWPEFIGETVLPIPFQEAAKEVWHYGLGANPEQQKGVMKGALIAFLMGGTGARLSEDYNP